MRGGEEERGGEIKEEGKDKWRWRAGALGRAASSRASWRKRGLALPSGGRLSRIKEENSLDYRSRPDDVCMWNTEVEGQDGLQLDCSSKREQIRLLLWRSAHLLNTVLGKHFVLFLGFLYL